MSGNKAVLMTKKSGSYTNSAFMLTESFVWEPSEGSASSSALTSSSSSWGEGGEHLLGKKGERNLGVKISELTIVRTTTRDAGMYTCRAESRAGSVSANFSLIVLHHNKTDNFTGKFIWIC